VKDRRRNVKKANWGTGRKRQVKEGVGEERNKQRKDKGEGT
jgi:hypothetical protein